ncbi:MAG TPA: glycosyltransferase, partial [Chthoniobacterales bacterium]|nr:glycosyltransferase [Chthoniobacterales bacterium]
MKILQLVHTLDPGVGGVASSVLALSRGMAERGNKIDIVVLDEASHVSEAAPNLSIHALGSNASAYRYSSELLPWLRKHGDNYDRVIVNGIWQYLSFAAWRRFAGSSIPYHVFPHGMLDPWFKRTFPLKHLKKWLYWPWAEYRVLRDATAVIFTSEEERLLARQSFWLYRANEKVSPLGIEASPDLTNARSQFLEIYPKLRDTRNFLFLGRLHPKKGCDMLIEAFSRVRFSESAVLIIAGPDQLGWEAELRAQVERLKVGDRVVFTGMLQGAMKQGAIASADAFVLPSHQENFGIAVAEALAAGVPVLISNRVNIWREVQADGAGFVDSDDLAGTIRL